MTTDQRKVQLEVGVDASGARAGFDQVKADAKNMAQSVGQSGKQAAQGLDGIGTGSDGAAQKLDKATRSMIGSVQRATAVMEAGERGSVKYFETLAQQRGVSSEALKPYLDQLRQAEVAQQAASGSLGKMGVSAAQTTAAMRQLPAQFTDIITSLQGGQAPLTVLMQQGGQIKDSFGGAGAAAKALGGYVLGMVNPFTIAAGVVGVLGYAYSQGSAESAAFNKTVILTGGIAGETAGQLSAMAKSMGNLGTNQSKAAETLNLFAQAGDVGAENLKRFTLAAIRMEAAGGGSVEQTAKAFAELGKAPLQTSIKFNESMNYLTASVYEQIRALDEQGKSTEAARVAQEAFANALETRAPSMLESLGLVDRAWNRIVSAINSAKSSMFSIGRQDTVQDQLSRVQNMIATKNAGLQDYKDTGAGKITQQEIDGLRVIEASLQERIRLETRSADVRAEQAKQVRASVQWDKDGTEFLSNKLKMEREIVKARNEGAEAGKTQAQIDERVAAIREKFKDKKEPQFSADAIEQAKLYAKLYEEAAKSIDGSEASLNGLTKEQAKLQEMLKDPDFQRMPEPWKNELIAIRATAVERERDMELRKRDAKETKEASDAYANAVEAQQKATSSLQDQIDKEREHVASIGLTKEALGDLLGRKLEDQAVSKDRLATLADEVDATGALGDAYRAQATALRELAELKRIGAAKEASADAAKQAAADWKRAAEHIEQSITDALMRGFESGKSFAENLRDTVVNMFKTMVLRPVVSAIVTPVSQGVMGMIYGGSPAMAGQDGSGGTGVSGVLGGNTAMGMNMMSGLKGWLTDFGGGVASQVSRFGNYLSGFSNSTVSEWGGALMDNASAIGGYAQVAGNALGYLNAAMAASEGKWGKAIGTGIGTYFGGPIGAAIGGAIGGWVDDAFGGGHEYTTDTGITGTFNRQGFSGRGYQDWRNNGSSGFFGFGGSGSSSGTNYSAIDSGASKNLSKAFLSVQEQTAGFAESLGLSADSIFNFSKDIRLSLGSDAEANKKAIESLLTGIADDLARTVLDSQYIREGEAAASTLARLAVNLSVVNGAFDTLEKSSLAIGQAGGDSASQLIDLLGGLDKFTSTTLSYYQTFYTEAERNAKTAEQLSASFAALGVAVPDSLQAYRDLVNAQDINTDAGRQMYAALMGLSGAFATVTSAASQAASSLIKAMNFSSYVDYAAASAAAGLTPPPRFAGGGDHVGGLRIVGENGPELEATGPARIWNDSQLRSAMGGQGGDATAAAIARLDENGKAQARALVSINARLVKIFDNWDINGMPEVRTL